MGRTSGTVKAPGAWVAGELIVGATGALEVVRRGAVSDRLGRPLSTVGALGSVALGCRCLPMPLRRGRLTLAMVTHHILYLGRFTLLLPSIL